MCFGSFTRVCHWGPFGALEESNSETFKGIIKIVTGVTIYCSGMWWPRTTIGGFLNCTVFLGLAGLTLYNFLSAMFHGPGYLPLNWKPENEADTVFLQFCKICNGYKAPRVHHCKKCNRCVLKMDHHCPWINNCVGWGNHAHFTAFLLFSVIACIQSSVILCFSLYRALYRPWYIYHSVRNVPIVYLNLYGLIACVFALGLSVGVVVAVGMLLFFQIRAIVRNRTGIEDWILEKAIHRRKGSDEEFIFPYDLGTTENIKQVVNWGCLPVGDGIHWPVKKGCDQYTLTREQLEQKNEKRERTKTYSIIHPASGSWFPISYGIGTFCHPPCTDEPRLKLQVGDIVFVTRWRKYWLFGEKHQPELTEDVPRLRGWFPRKCAVEATGNTPINNSSHSQDKKLQ